MGFIYLYAPVYSGRAAWVQNIEKKIS